MSILKLKPSCNDYLWGGSRLKEEYEKEYDGNVLAETWELSCHPDEPSYIANGEYAGKTLQQYRDAEGNYKIEGVCDALVTTIREKAAPVRIGIDIGGTDTKIGLVDIHQKIIVCEKMKTDASRSPEEIIREIGQKTLELLERQGIAIDQCVGAGIGVPGTIDRKNGIVRYSNNIKWENVEIVKKMGEFLPIPIRIANDADYAALGETVAGAGKECQDVIMLTLGTGVDGGIVLDGNIFSGGGIGGSELGHMVIVENGEPCTCGRSGCLEAYASATALVKSALCATGKKLSPQEIFEGAREGDSTLKEVVDLFISRLGTGIVNIINIFRPQLVLLGGGLSGQGEKLVEPLSDSMKKECFGGDKSELPEIEIAALGNEAGMIGAASLI